MTLYQMLAPRPLGASYPRYFTVAGRSVNSYQVLLCVGIYVGSIATAVLAQRSGHSPLAFGMAAALCALAGLIGARLYHVGVNARVYFAQPGWRALWDSRRGGWSVFGALITFVPASLVAAALLGVHSGVLWDCMAPGVLAGGFWIRSGCVLNGCCAGRPTDQWYGVRLHDTRGVVEPRVPVQFVEMLWWAAGFAGFISLWPRSLGPGTYALAVVAWYGAGRFVLEPFRARPDVVLGRVRINQVVAAVLAAGAGSVLVLRWFA